MSDTTNLYLLIAEYTKELRQLVNDLIAEQLQAKRQITEMLPQLEQRLSLQELEVKHIQVDCSKCDSKYETKFKDIERRLDLREEKCQSRADRYIKLDKSFTDKTNALDKKLIKIIAWASGFGIAAGFFGRMMWEHIIKGG